MADDDQKFSRREPPEDNEWPLIWSGIDKAHKGWPVVKILVALNDNWKLVAVLIAVAVLAGGRDILKALGVDLP